MVFVANGGRAMIQADGFVLFVFIVAMLISWLCNAFGDG